jgi:hypothetical protein
MNNGSSIAVEKLQAKFLADSAENSLDYWKEWQARGDSLALSQRREPQTSGFFIVSCRAIQ